MHLVSTLIGLGIDLVAISILVFGVYRPRHSKSDLALSYLALNLGIFGAVALLSQAEGSMALGMGLFGILSIIRLRSSSISQTEVTYYFVSLVLGLLNALGVSLLPFLIVINVLLVGILIILDKGAVAIAATPTEQRMVVLDTIIEDVPSLRLELEERLGIEVKGVNVKEIDYVRDVMVCVVLVVRPHNSDKHVVEKKADHISGGHIADHGMDTLVIGNYGGEKQ